MSTSITQLPTRLKVAWGTGALGSAVLMNSVTIAYVLAVLVLYTLGPTIFNVPYLAMPAEMTDGYHERSSLHSYRVVSISIGSSVAGAPAPILLLTNEPFMWLIATKALQLLGMCLGGNILLANSILTDTIDLDARRSGMRREGIYAAM
jgi:Na+/melibiose symporter-like transporter